MGRRLLALLSAVWVGLLLTVAGIATPAAFALLPSADAGRIAARVLAQEAWLALTLAAVLARLSLSAGAGRTVRVVLAAAALCTLLGYFGVQWLLPAARAGQGLFGFGQLHAFSTACYAVKVLLVAWLAWRATAPLSPAPASSG
jgi:hypothetical protein